MPAQEFHLSDRELLLAADGELSARDSERVESHLAACWTCRTRQREIEAAIGDFVRMHRQNFETQIPPADGPRALLKARMAQLAHTQRRPWLEWLPSIPWKWSWAILGAICALGAMTYLIYQPWAVRQAERPVAVTTPDPNLTPGAIVLVSRGEVCSASNENNKAVPVAVRRTVFGEYGIRTAEPSAYEVDYLITPGLGGSDDIHNLWPQSTRATVWNAQVKDALEDHLRDLVCDGKLDLATAQRDMATNWIQAYKKYFHTDQPLSRFR
ncbi:MAG TPA: zf-HC2 domain-containing protein [Bryobacteraceae bacterium]|nr:zf-HC2 domain-containing protein [Bryobacteraceae bacterium]